MSWRRRFERAPWTFVRLGKIPTASAEYAPDEDDYSTASEAIFSSTDEPDIATSLARINVREDQPSGYGTHFPVLDLDIPAALLPSSTYGHHSLYLGVEVSTEQYMKLLDVLAECGILEPGYVNASRQRGFTAVRLPWISKPQPPEPQGFVPCNPQAFTGPPEHFDYDDHDHSACLAHGGQEAPRA